MESNSIKISGDNSKFLSVTLNDVLANTYGGDEYNWSIIWLEAIGNIGKSMPDFEKEVRESENGIIIKWEDLIELATNIDQTIDIVLIGDKNILNLKRYDSEEEMYSACYHVFKLIDSSYWIIHSKSDALIAGMKIGFSGVEDVS
jgi:hypothetical protein